MSAPIAGPMTRDRFIWTDVSETAPVRSSRGTSVGRIALSPGAPSALAMPIANTITTMRTRDGCDCHATNANPNDSAPWSTCMLTSSRRRSTRSARSPPIIDRKSNGPSCPKYNRPDVEPAVRERQPVRTEDDVLHPRADVRRERAAVDDAEVAVAQRRRGRSPLHTEHHRRRGRPRRPRARALPPAASRRAPYRGPISCHG